MLGPYFAQDAFRNQITLKFRLQYASGAKADFQVPAGAIASNTRTSAGVYTMTMNQKYPVFVGGLAHVMAATADDAKIVNFAVAGYNATTGVLTFTVLDDDGDGTYTATDFVDNDWVFFELTFCDRSTMSPTGALT